MSDGNESGICGGRGTFAILDDMTWPRADNTTGAVESALRHGEQLPYALRHGDPRLSPKERRHREDILVAASVIAAYRHLVWCPRSKREAVIRRLREVAKKFPADEDGNSIP